MATIKISETVQSVFESDVLDVVADAEAFGLDPEEARVLALIASCVRGERFARPEPDADLADVRLAIVAMANGYDDIVIGLVTSDAEQRRFARYARDGLTALARHLHRRVHTPGAT